MKTPTAGTSPAKKLGAVKFRITYFSGDTVLAHCLFNIEGPELSRERFAAVHKILEDEMEFLNAEQGRIDAAKEKKL